MSEDVLETLIPKTVKLEGIKCKNVYINETCQRNTKTRDTAEEF